MKKAIALASVLLASASAWAGIVTWQVDLNPQINTGNFIVGTDQLVIRGSINGWGGNANAMIDPENDGVYTYSFDHAAVSPPYEYKYVIVHSWGDEWENHGLIGGNRTYAYDGSDLDLPVEFFNNVEGEAPVCDVEITFQVDMNVQIVTGAFDPMGDTVGVRGTPAPLDWDLSIDMSDGDADGIYDVTVPFDMLNESTVIEHKFVINGSNWEGSPNRMLNGDCGWPDDDMNGYVETTLAPVFFGDVSFDAITDHDIVVTFNVDATPIACWFAMGLGDNGGLTSYGDLDFISVHGFFNGWPAWYGNIDPMYRALPDGGYMWTVDILFPAGSGKVQGYKYGANGWDNESGFGQDHSFDLSTAGEEAVLVIDDVFGSLGTQWDCEWTVDANEQPAAFQLAPAFPNPFNPTTTIRFSLEQSAVAELAVYNLTGARVATLVQGLTAGGEHSVVFDASALSSGVYVATLSAEGTSLSQKLVLVK